MAFSVPSFLATMERRTLIPAATIVIITAVVTALVYQPVSIGIYKIREPYFKYPIETTSAKPVIRNDSLGEGEYGSKRSSGRSHTGVDFQAPIGTPIYAAKSGVAFCGEVPAGYGKYIMIYHPDGMQTLYGHLSSWGVFSTQNVRQGDLIGFVGKTGNAANASIQPHLHFEIRKDGKPQDPQRLMRYDIRR